MRRKSETSEQESGHFLLKLGDPIKAGKLRRGMKVQQGGEMVEIIRVLNPAHEDFPHMMLVNIRYPDNSPHNPKDGTIVPRVDDVFYRQIVSKTRQDTPTSGNAWRSVEDSPGDNPGKKKEVEPASFDPFKRGRRGKVVAASKPAASDPSDFFDEVPEPVAPRKPSTSKPAGSASKPASRGDFSPRGPKASAPVAGANEIELRIADGLYEGLKAAWDEVDLFSERVVNKTGDSPSLAEVLGEAVHKQWWHAVLNKRQALRFYSCLLVLSEDVWPSIGKGAWARASLRLITEMKEKFGFSSPERFSDEDREELGLFDGGSRPSKPAPKRRAVVEESPKQQLGKNAWPLRERAVVEELEEIPTLPARRRRRTRK